VLERRETIRREATATVRRKPYFALTREPVADDGRHCRRALDRSHWSRLPTCSPQGRSNAHQHVGPTSNFSLHRRKSDAAWRTGWSEEGRFA
jgi:hypothetical protein